MIIPGTPACPYNRRQRAFHVNTDHEDAARLTSHFGHFNTKAVLTPTVVLFIVTVGSIVLKEGAFEQSHSLPRECTVATTLSLHQVLLDELHDHPGPVFSFMVVNVSLKAHTGERNTWHIFTRRQRVYRCALFEIYKDRH